MYINLMTEARREFPEDLFVMEENHNQNTANPEKRTKDMTGVKRQWSSVVINLFNIVFGEVAPIIVTPLTKRIYSTDPQ